eukprot:gene4881-biopygen6912
MSWQEKIESVRNNTCESKLCLNYNNIGTEGARALAEALMQNVSVTDTVRVLVTTSAMKERVPLQSLGLNSIGAEGTCAFADALKHNTTLTELECVITIIDT